MGRYRVGNWAKYNKALVKRGSINIWFSEDAIKKWHTTDKTGNRGRPQVYSNDAILCALLVRSVFKLPLRGLEGFLASLVTLLDLAISIPCYTQICRRARELGKELKKLSCKLPTDIVFDSTGLKVYGEGEWKVRQHGIGKRREWRKLHIGIDVNSQQIIVMELTYNSKGDAETASSLIDKVPNRVKRVYGDGAYDGMNFRKKVGQKGAKPIIPPPKNAVIRSGTDPATQTRNQAVREIAQLGGDDRARALWKKLKGYHSRSIVETAMYRYKCILGGTLRSREERRQWVEAAVGCLIINKMTELGMPLGMWDATA